MLLLLYLRKGSEYERAPVLHVPSEGENGVRLLCHFYTFLHFADASRAAEMRRWARDRMHYADEIFCVAARVVAELRQLARGRVAGRRVLGVHVRRGGSSTSA